MDGCRVEEHQWARRAAFALLLAVAIGPISACGGSDGGDGEDVDGGPSVGEDLGGDATVDRPGDRRRLQESTSYYRIDLRRSTSSVSIEGVSTLTRPEGSFAAHPPLGGNYLVAAYADGELRRATPLKFPESAISEGQTGDGQRFTRSISLESSNATAFVRADAEIDRIELRDADNDTVATLSGDDLPTAPTQRQNLRRQRLSSPFGGALSHIRVLGPGDKSVLPPKLAARVETIAKPTQKRLSKLETALNKLGPETATGVHNVAFGHFPDHGCVAVDSSCGSSSGGGVKVHPICKKFGAAQTDENGNPAPTGITSGQAWGASLLLNVDNFSESTVIHESVHCYNNLLDAAWEGDPKWPQNLVQTAVQTLEEHGLARKYGLSRAWDKLHQSAIDVGRSRPYEGSSWCNLGSGEAVQAGFTTPYGSKSFKEDIAEYGATLQSGSAGALCGEFQSISGKEIPKRLALAYGKLLLSRAVGTIDDSNFDNCVKGIDLKSRGKGIHLNDSLALRDETKYGFYESEGLQRFGMLGQNKASTYGFLLEVAVETTDRPPVGVYRLESIDTASIIRSNATFQPVSEDAVYLNHEEHFKRRASGGGLALVSEVTSDHATGAILFLELNNLRGETTDTFPFVTFHIEQ